MKAKNILYIGNKLSKHGYTPTSIETLGFFLQREGYAMSFSSEKKSQFIRFIDMGFAVIQNRKKLDYVLIDTYSTFSFWYAFTVSLLCKFFTIKYIPILRGGSFPQRLQNSPKLTRSFLNGSYKNIVVSGYLQSELQKRGATNMELIPNNIELNLYPFKKRQNLRLRLLWVRSFHKIYNVPLALYLLQKLLKEYPDAELTMVGPDKDGTLEECKQLSKELGIEKQVRFTGRLAKKEWIALSAGYDIFINTTNVDNLPVSVIEAMALGMVVISTNVGGVPYLIENEQNGMLVNPDDLEGMYAVVKGVIADPKLAGKLSINARTTAEKYDWNTIRHQWRALLGTTQ